MSATPIIIPIILFLLCGLTLVSAILAYFKDYKKEFYTGIYITIFIFFAAITVLITG